MEKIVFFLASYIFTASTVFATFGLTCLCMRARDIRLVDVFILAFICLFWPFYVISLAVEYAQDGRNWRG